MLNFSVWNTETTLFSRGLSLVKSEKKIPDSLIQGQLEYWLEGVSSDLATAIAIFEKTDRYGASLFFLHLSLERQLKALFVKKFEFYAPLSHNLLSLAERCDLTLTEDHASYKGVCRRPSDSWKDIAAMDFRTFKEIAVAVYHSLGKVGIHVDGVILFGSHARGVATEDSDIDLAILSRDFGKDRFKEGALVNIHVHRAHPSAEAVPVTLREWFSPYPVSPIVHEIKKHGIFII
ncbi:MAG: nucleotidyltransferase domain-containing protein [Proteobacteria bacterium]|nr:nucleotidyltransferase domain-containing protein [Pseudomonadota bacterium]